MRELKSISITRKVMGIQKTLTINVGKKYSLLKYNDGCLRGTIHRTDINDLFKQANKFIKYDFEEEI